MVISDSKIDPINKDSLFLQQEEDFFQWTKQWYPVAVVDHLNSSHPHAIQLLGKDLVLWRDGENQWRCFDDLILRTSKSIIKYYS